jgi:hypothetical protein
MNSLIAGISGISSLIGMLTGTLAQGVMVRQELRPPQQQQVQSCPANTIPQWVTASNGERVQICLAPPQAQVQQ